MASEFSDPVVDATIIRRLVELLGDGASVAGLIQTFLGEAPELVDAIVAAVDEHSAGKALQAAHTLKSSAAAVGALRLCGMSARVEALARSDQVDSARALSHEMHSSLDEARVLLTAEILRLGGSAP